MAYAGAAAVQLTGPDTPVRKLIMPLPLRLKQAAEVAEDYAAVMAAFYSEDPSLVIDRMSTVKHAKDPSAALSPESATAGIWRELYNSAWPRARKVKAHGSRADAWAEGGVPAVVN